MTEFFILKYMSQLEVKRQLISYLQDKLDPNGILSPGKQGIWPQRWKTFMSERAAINGDRVPKTGRDRSPPMPV